MKVQDIIKSRRLELGLTMKDVAKALGVSEGTISRYESGEIQNMGIDKIEALSKVFHCSPGYLMGWEINPDNLSSTNIHDDEKNILTIFRSLNTAGQKKLYERAIELRDLGYVKKVTGITA